MKSNGCPYARGSDSLKLHYLFMSRGDAKKMDEEIKSRQDPDCGRPIHPGSNMCKEHMRYSRGYHASRTIPYPVTDGQPPHFTCQHSPIEFDSEERWISHTRDGSFAGAFKTEAEAKTTIDQWNASSSERVTIAWKAPSEDAPECDRGTYTVGLKGTRFTVRTGSQDSSGEIQKRLRNAICKYGFAVVSEILFAGQDQLTRYGWDGAKDDAPFTENSPKKKKSDRPGNGRETMSPQPPKERLNA